MLLLSLFLGWIFSAHYLDQLIPLLFELESHEDYPKVWFRLFVGLECLIILFFAFVYWKLRKQQAAINPD